jgi:hypothetical protein
MPHVGEDRTPPVRRTTVAEAAELLGISAEAVRGRIRRGTIPVEREGGTVYVLLEVPVDDRTTADQPRTTGDQPTDRTDALIDTLTQQIEDLREQVRSERQAHAEARRLLAAALERIPAIEAPQEPSEPPSEATEQPGRVEPQPAVQSTQAQESHEMHMPSAGGGPQPRDRRSQTPSERPWWRRMFGG